MNNSNCLAPKTVYADADQHSPSDSLYISKPTMDATIRMQLSKGRRELDTDSEEVMLATGEGDPSPNPPMLLPPNPKSGLLPFSVVGGVPKLLNIIM